MKTEDAIEFVCKNDFDELKIEALNRECPGYEASMAIELISRWGMIAAEVDGEDSSGRSKIRRMTPGELVEHATATAGQAIAKFRELGWIKVRPSYKEIAEDHNKFIAEETVKDGKNSRRWNKAY